MTKQYLFVFKTGTRKYFMLNNEEFQEHFNVRRNDLAYVYVGKDCDSVCVYDYED